MLAVDELAASVAARVAPEGDAELLSEETRRIARSGPGSDRLPAAEILVLAGLIVQVCVVVVDSAKLIHNFLEKPKHDRLLEVLARLAEKTGDQGTTNDEAVKKVASAALDVLNERKVPKKP